MNRALPSGLAFAEVLALMLALALATPSAAQTVWFKYKGNPVMDVGPAGAWDGAHVAPGRVLVQESRYRMWYSGFSGARQWHTGYATSPDGIAWTRHGANPVLRAGPGAWEEVGATHPYVLQHGSTYEMWYTGGDGARILQTGYATSADGLHWEKARDANPIMRVEGGLPWYDRSFSRHAVMRPDSLADYRMWFAGESESGVIQIGFATSSDGRDWSISPDPVLRPGEPGSWDETSLFFPRVLYTEGAYHMWFGGMTSAGYPTRRIGYATSPDGLQWSKHPDNPVLVTGPPGSWDDYAVLVGDLHFDDVFYHLWYLGEDGMFEVGAGRIGYAISPRGAHVEVGPPFALPGAPVRLAISVDDAASLSFAAVIRWGDDGEIQLPLYDDGRHGDGITGDGTFANMWVPPGAERFTADLVLEHRHRRFILEDAGAFTTIGPIRYATAALLGDATPNPGDSLRLRLELRHEGTAGSPPAVAASLASPDSCVRVVADGRIDFGDLRPAGVTSSLGTVPLFIDPDCPAGTAATLQLAISSAGVPFWTDTFTLLVAAPWWRTQWAYGAYALLAIVILGGSIRYGEMRRLRRRIDLLEREHALERERMRISQDMHDDIGSRLTEIGILSELASREVMDPNAEAQIRKIAETSREVIGNISEIIWAIDARHDASEDVVAYLRHYASRFLEPTGIELTASIPDPIPAFRLPAAARRNLFLVAKEALHNVVKHAEASRVQLRIAFPPDAIEVEIEDDGVGFDTETPAPFGHGLEGMKARIQDIGATLDVTSSPDRGTTVRVRCPGQ